MGEFRGAAKTYHPAMRYLITDHAIERYVERVHPALPLKDVQNLPSVLFETRRILETFAPRSAAIREKTRAGQEQRRLDRPKPCVLVCKHDPGAIAVVTVLGPEETLSEADEEIAEQWERFLVESFVEKTKRSAKCSHEQTKRPVVRQVMKSIVDAPDDAIRRVVVPMIRNEIGGIFDRLARMEAKSRQTDDEPALVIVAREREKTERKRIDAEVSVRKAAEKTARMKLYRDKRDDVVKVAVPVLARLAGESAIAAEAMVRIVEIDPSVLGLSNPKDEPS